MIFKKRGKKKRKNGEKNLSQDKDDTEVISRKIFTFGRQLAIHPPTSPEKYWQAISFQELLTSQKIASSVYYLRESLPQGIWGSDFSLFKVFDATNILSFSST